MKELENISLETYTTIKVGGVAKKLYVPETNDELIELIRNKKPKYYIGGGSNLLIANIEFDTVVDLKEFNNIIDVKADGVFIVGASVRLQRVINEINKHGFGGIEYLFSVPGTVGGAVVMNAGRGKQYNKSISDYIDSVTAIKIDSGEIVTIVQSDCGFSYRNSIFKKNEYVIISVKFHFEKMDIQKSSELKRERLELCKKLQDTSKPNFGSVFMKYDYRIISLAMRLRFGNKKAHFSSLTPNWIINESKADYKSVRRAIRIVELLHKLTFKKCEKEVIIWE